MYTNHAYENILFVYPKNWKYYLQILKSESVYGFELIIVQNL